MMARSFGLPLFVHQVSILRLQVAPHGVGVALVTLGHGDRAICGHRLAVDLFPFRPLHRQRVNVGRWAGSRERNARQRRPLGRPRSSKRHPVRPTTATQPFSPGLQWSARPCPHPPRHLCLHLRPLNPRSPKSHAQAKQPRKCRQMTLISVGDVSRYGQSMKATIILIWFGKMSQESC